MSVKTLWDNVLQGYKIYTNWMDMKTRIEKPIFMVGAGRSGTTIIYEMLAWHKDLAWISNYSNRYYSNFPLSAIACRFYRARIAKKLLGARLPRPAEGYRVWNWCHPVDRSPHDPPLTEADVTPGIRKRCLKMVADHLRYAGKKRFVNKNTRNSRRIRYLNSIFKDGKFIHLIRDGRAVIASMVTVWDKLGAWFICEKNSSRMSDINDKKLEIAAEIWMREVEIILQDKKSLNPSQYIEIRYENFVKAPADTIRKVCEFCEIEWTNEHGKFIEKRNVVNKNYRYKQRLSTREVQRIEEITGNLMNSLNYV